MMGKRCRVWWPKQLSLRKPSSSSNFLLGWFVSSPPSSLDVVVAFAYTEFALSGLQSSLQGILRNTNGRMPVLLQDKSMLCVVGQIFKDLIEEDHSHSSSCGCHELSGSVEQCRDDFEGKGYWIQMLCDPKEQVGKDIAWIPKLHHLILYETPTYGAHHFSLHPWNSFEQVSAPMRKPNWVDELHQKQQLLDLDTVILAINSSATAEIVFSSSRIHIRIRGSQILYWPIFLQDNGMRLRFRSLSSVEYAEKAALHKRSMWSSLAVDIQALAALWRLFRDIYLLPTSSLELDSGR
ncbi:hypothetical protein DVH24_011912 [Malus domestica]|uniref:Uncharacterized protein n=1 Tax=Malus domestica TaxID=3750 RepID=A0A498JAZ1_MALDO|nr:hypothetical protein DVH24_011912 [Malus domestica]